MGKWCSGGSGGGVFQSQGRGRRAGRRLAPGKSRSRRAGRRLAMGKSLPGRAGRWLALCQRGHRRVGRCRAPGKSCSGRPGRYPALCPGRSGQPGRRLALCQTSNHAALRVFYEGMGTIALRRSFGAMQGGTMTKSWDRVRRRLRRSDRRAGWRA